MIDRCLKVIDPLANRGDIIGQKVLRFAQILFKTRDGLFFLSILFEATPLIIDMGRVVGIKEEVSQYLGALLRVARQARPLGSPDLGL
jgi:hypothetical protein